MAIDDNLYARMGQRFRKFDRIVTRTIINDDDDIGDILLADFLERPALLGFVENASEAYIL